MAAAYAGLVSVKQIMDQIHRHPHPPISLDEKQSESLTANVTFLQEFLQGYNLHLSYSSGAEPLESRIAEAAYAAEDVIETYIVDQILSRFTDHVEEISSTQFYQGLQKVIEELDLIKMEIEIEKMNKKNIGVDIVKNSTTNAGSFRFPSTSTAQKEKVTTMVGFDDVLYQMLDKLTGGECVRQIIPIVGMAGLGKTTLAQNIYANPLIKEHFDICVWSTISRVHNARKILSEILGQLGLGNEGDLSECDLGDKLYKHLFGRRYLIVMDDMWRIEAWDAIRMFFPDNENGSRVVVTTRLSNLASQFNYSNGLDMKLLDRASSWSLFCKTVFREEICPLELEKIGKKIVEGCRGLPLSIIVVGGLLLKSEPTQESWELIEENLSSIVNSAEDERCLQILYTSYINLPVYLKPCFLYIGMFYGDEEIIVVLLIMLMVAEGFMKSFDEKSLEEAAEDCIQELVDRNLIIVEERDYLGKVSSLKMHDLLRDLALREGGKDKFICDLMQSSDHREISSDIISTQRRITALLTEEYSSNPLFESIDPSSSRVRSLLGKFSWTSSIPNFRLLRVCFFDSPSVEEESSNEHYEENFIRLVNLRFIFVNVEEHSLTKIPSFLWNLQTLYLVNIVEEFVLDIWRMPLLRHVFTDDNSTLRLSDPPLSDDVMYELVLHDLKTLVGVSNLTLTGDVLIRIPNINKLQIDYFQISTSTRGEELGNDFCLNNICRLHKLQVLRITDPLLAGRHTITFPYSLKELALHGTMLHWEEMETKIGCLPLLQVLKLEYNSFTGSEWKTVEGQFLSLKYLLIENCLDLEYWITDSTHFPCLESLIFRFLTKLREIPSSIGDIPTLRLIKLQECNDSAEESALRIEEEQEEYGNELLEIQCETVIEEFVREWVWKHYV